MLKTTNAEFYSLKFGLQTKTIDHLNKVRIKMRYSLEPTYRRYVKGYGFLSFAKKI